MARGRMINTTIATDKRLNSMSQDAIMLFVMTVPHLDRDGLIVGDANLLYSRVCPRLPYMLERIAPAIEEWVKSGLVMRYETDEDPVLFFTGFNDNQAGMRYDRETESIYPSPPGFYRTPEGMFPSNSGTTPAVVGSNSGTTPAVVGSNSGTTPAVVGSNSPIKLNKDQDQDNITTTTPLPPQSPNMAAQSGGGGGGGDALPLNFSEQSCFCSGTIAPSPAEATRQENATVTANAAPPVATPPPAVQDDPLAELSSLLLANGFGEIRPATRPLLLGWLDLYQLATIGAAIRTAAANGKTSLYYVEGVLKGNGSPRKQGSNAFSGNGKQHFGNFGNFGNSGNGVNHASGQSGSSQSGISQSGDADEPLDAATIQAIKDANRRVRDKVAAAALQKMQ